MSLVKHPQGTVVIGVLTKPIYLNFERISALAFVLLSVTYHEGEGITNLFSFSKLSPGIGNGPWISEDQFKGTLLS